jgi:hypothetical protein
MGKCPRKHARTNNHISHQEFITIFKTTPVRNSQLNLLRYLFILKSLSIVIEKKL